MEKKKYSIKVSGHIYKKIEEHISALKYVKKSNISKKDWIEEAVKEKFDIEKDFSFGQLPKSKHISFTLTPELEVELEKRVNFVKEVNDNFSKKRMIIEAIFEKLEREQKMKENIYSEIQKGLK